MNFERRDQVVALLRGASDSHEPIDKFGEDHGYPLEIRALAKDARTTVCCKTPLGEWHGSVWDEMSYAADLLENNELWPTVLDGSPDDVREAIATGDRP